MIYFIAYAIFRTKYYCVILYLKYVSLFNGLLKTFIVHLQGDSGGGMFCENNDGHYTIAGIISWGSARCDQGTVLTDIAQYHTWIQEVTNS